MEKSFGKKGKLNYSDIWNSISRWWDRSYRVVFAFVMFLILLLGIYYWYDSLHLGIMTEQEKKDYRTIKDRSTIFLENDFNDAVKYIDHRSANFNSPWTERKDIFK